MQGEPQAKRHPHQMRGLVARTRTAASRSSLLAPKTALETMFKMRNNEEVIRRSMQKP